LCLGFRAVINTSPGLRVPLSYLAFALGGATAAALAGWTGGRGWRWWHRAAVVGPLALVGVTVTAGGVAHGWAGALAPWELGRQVEGGVAGAGWSLGLLVWVRGTTIGWPEATAAHAVRSGLLGSVVMTALLLGRAADDPSFNRATPGAGWLFALFVAGMGVTIALTRERDLERRYLLRPTAGTPGLPWLGILAAPLAATAGLAFLLAVAAGPVAKPVAEAAKVATDAAGDGVRSGWRSVTDRLGDADRAPDPTPAPVPEPASEPDRPRPNGAVFSISRFLVVALLVGTSLFAGAWLLVRLGQLRLPGLGLGVGGHWWARPGLYDEERESVFEARGFLARLLGRLAALFGRRRPRTGTGGPTAAVPERAPSPPVRREYRQVLIAARQRGEGRHPAETVEEFEARLSGHLDPRETDALAALGQMYTGVRYGDLTADERDTELARDAAGRLVQALAVGPPTTTGGPAPPT
jgi:hypothetical protein